MNKLFGILLFVLASRALNAQEKIVTTCRVPEPSVNASVTEYARKKYHISFAEQLTLSDVGQVNEECYWKYHFTATSPRLDITLYLAPDRRFLSNTLYDRMEDPLAEEKQQRIETAKSLIGPNSPRLGPDQAAVSIVVFSDFQYSYCQRLTSILEKEILPADPDVNVVFKHFPLSIHPYARIAARIAACGAMQNNEAFWTLHDYIFTHQRELTVNNIEERGAIFAQEQPDLDQTAFHDCIQNGSAAGLIANDEVLGRKLGVHATPTLFINGNRVVGVRDGAQLKQFIRTARAGQLIATPPGSQ